MLISPPFLPAIDGTINEEAWLARTMPVPPLGEGKFPVSFNLGWHGGVHLTAPVIGNACETVRAISDGTIIFVRMPVEKTSDDQHPLNYRGGWTDNGCVVIRHETAIGDGANASNIIFYSVYMHLSKLDISVKKGRKICRKAELGDPGQIYGDLERKIHLEIVCDDTNMSKLCGRLKDDLDILKDGRDDAIYGEIYFRVPAGTKIYAERPMANSVEARLKPTGSNSNQFALRETCTTEVDFIIGVEYSPRTGNRRNGDARVVTYSLNGDVIGAPIIESDAEYDMYLEARRISEAYPKTARPSVSALFELLRFGRITNTDRVAVPVPIWRKICFPDGHGWVNSNSANVIKFSDADLPHWKGWSVVNDSEDQDCRCDSPTIKSWMKEISGQDPTSPSQNCPPNNFQQKLARAICKFPSEWSGASIDKRWAWLARESSDNPTPLSAADFVELKAHIRALCFEEPVLDEALWHWHPYEFIAQFRRCGWLSERELIRCIPAAFECEQGKRGSTRTVTLVSLNVAKQRLAKLNPSLFMQICRKYGLDQPARFTHFLAQIYRETAVFQYGEELATGAEYEGRETLKNVQAGDGVRFKGRGLIQTTGRVNYEKYADYRGRQGMASFTVEPNNLLLATDAYCCADTAGLYWVSRRLAAGNCNINRIADKGVTEEALRSVTESVNGKADGPSTGLFERRSHLNVVAAVLLDDLRTVFPAVERKNV
jgi:predicted chitinase